MNETQNTNAGATANAYPGNNPPPGEFQNFGSTIPPKGPKRKKGLLIGGVILVILALITGITLYLKHKEKVEREEALRQKIAQQEAEKAEIGGRKKDVWQ